MEIFFFSSIKWLLIPLCFRGFPGPGGFPAGASGKEPTLPMQEMQETQVQSLGWEDPLEEETATHCSIGESHG